MRPYYTSSQLCFVKRKVYLTRLVTTLYLPMSRIRCLLLCWRLCQNCQALNSSATLLSSRNNTITTDWKRIDTSSQPTYASSRHSSKLKWFNYMHVLVRTCTKGHPLVLIGCACSTCRTTRSRRQCVVYWPWPWGLAEVDAWTCIRWWRCRIDL